MKRNSAAAGKTDLLILNHTFFTAVLKVNSFRPQGQLQTGVSPVTSWCS
jgi:hypothetical protein